MSIHKLTLIISILAIISFACINTVLSQESKHSFTGIQPELVAEFIFSVIEADRTLYARHVVGRMQETGTVIASESWMHRKAIPLPSQMLLMAGKRVEDQGLGLRYRLASLWPIYEKNGPATEFERKGLEAVAQDPETPYSGIVHKAKKSYFKTIYSDKAVSTACVNCHNSHVLSPKRDYQLHDVMGGVIISFPLN